MIHTFLGETIHYEIQYKNRSSFAIKLDGYGTVEVFAPKGTSNEQVLKLLEGNWVLIQQKLKEMKDRMHGTKEKVYEHGESFLYLGKTYPIQIHGDPSITQDHVVFEADKLHIYVRQHDDQKIKQALKRFYYKQCKALVEKSISSYQSHFKTKPRSISISDSKTTWGTCDSRRQLTFNWRLAMAPQKVIDYVVIHEMCHLVHLNHDRSFWRLVGKIMPDYKEQENWLELSSWKMTV
ncbi:M48 family metallopeptidase [Niallia nealsonii]|uniref:M48 family peptidase n=1 Tax=Niallia nealsonii TaxID=115979 RepID=A0A2N0Z0T1_9BACI|nr:SprT family zinc-dependent metalloprotease [Niallia nealsonii]PKG23120.1 M48 family peptidase [Niallia nealsonii]